MSTVLFGASSSGGTARWQEFNVSIDQAIKVITSNVAELLKLDNKGRIEKGRDADFVIVNKENLIFAGFRGEAWNDITSSSGIPDYMGALIGITSVTSAVKYGINQL